MEKIRRLRAKEGYWKKKTCSPYWLSEAVAGRFPIKADTTPMVECKKCGKLYPMHYCTKKVCYDCITNNTPISRLNGYYNIF